MLLIAKVADRERMHERHRPTFHLHHESAAAPIPNAHKRCSGRVGRSGNCAPLHRGEQELRPLGADAQRAKRDAAAHGQHLSFGEQEHATCIVGREAQQQDFVGSGHSHSGGRA